MKIIVLRGLPASGKTTWARAYLADHRGRAGRVCRDDVREHVLGASMRAGDAVLDRAGEDVVSAVVDAAVIALLSQGLDVIIDATNLHERNIRRWRQLAEIHSCDIEIVHLDVDARECVRRDAVRAAAGQRHVGAAVIWRMARVLGGHGTDI